MALLFTILRTGNDFSCRAGADKPFFVGRRVPYEGNIGLYNIFSGAKLEKRNFVATDFEGQSGFWAHFIEPTALCEGRNFLTLNTYDRAAFTFGFGQFAAHVPGGDFVRYFRAMLGLPEASDYFPHLAVIGGLIHRSEDGVSAVPLETESSTQALMNYLNPGLDEVQDSEVIAAAKLIHWTAASASARKTQVDQMIATFRDFMLRADRRLGIDGLAARECCVIADILHHGRGGRNMTWPRLQSALQSGNPYEALLQIGLPPWLERLRTLRRALNARPAFMALKWNSAAQNFV
ncbi:hypothetical protein [Bosea sp. 124]|uniref:hypothetical protein n=1 Tax=Bosea sp. 124 TaxID=2135642 RepID=UPI000D35AA87|nr:hypothetical protein [Bosea sp. 124]PTM43064.1 hypothetical protein C8D03_4669 [Bosea sp. 124]